MKKSNFLLSLLLSIMFISDISAQELTMFSGFGGLQYYEDDVKITKAEINQRMQKNEITNMYWSKSKRHYNISLAAFGAQIVTSYFALASLNNSSSLSNRSWAFFAASIGAGAISFGYSLSSASLKKKAILGYNKLQEEGLTYHIGTTTNGLGIVCAF